MVKGKIVLITGGGGLIGSHLSKSILKQGGKVIILDKDIKSLSKFKNYSKNLSFKKIIADFTDMNELDSCIKESIDHFGRIDAVIHSAYPKYSSWGTKFEDLKKDDLNRHLNDQLGGAILFSQKILNYFKKQGYGNLIHISSIQASNAPKFDHYIGTSMVSPIEYSAIKAGILAITKYLSKYYKNSNIRVNSISPGGIIDNQPIRFQKKYKKSCNDKGLLDVEDIVGTAIFLISDQSRYINGQNIIVDDGWSL